MHLSEKEFNSKRRMFAFVAGRLLVASPGDTRSHREWLAHAAGVPVDDEFLENNVRGFYLEPSLVLYKRTEGDDFSHFGVAHAVTGEQLHLLRRTLGIPDETEVFFGARLSTTVYMRGHARLGGTISSAAVRLDHDVKKKE